MKIWSEFRNPQYVQGLVEQIRQRANGRQITLMEVCGTHTMAIHRFGLRKLLPENIELLSGPGCPVCVTPNDYLDRAIALSQIPDVIITTFGDMVKVPGSYSSLEKEQASGGDVRIVYSPLDALEIARQNPDKKVIFLGVGFETTTPTVATVLKMAIEQKLKNFYVLSAHKLIPPAMAALMQTEQSRKGEVKTRVQVDGFLCPGHVSAIIGSEPYRFLAEQYGKACVVTGFEPLDILQAISMLVEQIVTDKPAVAIQYRRVVRPEGNPQALSLLEEMFEVEDTIWRGIGSIPQSGLKIREQFGNLDAAKQIEVEIPPSVEPKGCICGLVLQGLKKPVDCPLFAVHCTPESPVGACMVSSEGTCAAYYKYGE